MKKTFIMITSVFLIITGGWLILKAIQETNFLQTEKPRIEKYLKYNYENIETVTFEKVTKSSMGVPHIEGYVNNNKDMSFDAGVYDKHFEAALDSTGDVPLTRTDYAIKFGDKSVSEIEKEEVEQKK